MKILVSPFDQFEKHHFGSEDMCADIAIAGNNADINDNATVLPCIC